MSLKTITWNKLNDDDDNNNDDDDPDNEPQIGWPEQQHPKPSRTLYSSLPPVDLFLNKFRKDELVYCGRSKSV